MNQDVALHKTTTSPNNMPDVVFRAFPLCIGFMSFGCSGRAIDTIHDEALVRSNQRASKTAHLVNNNEKAASPGPVPERVKEFLTPSRHRISQFLTNVLISLGRLYLHSRKARFVLVVSTHSSITSVILPETVRDLLRSPSPPSIKYWRQLGFQNNNLICS
jgi:hypothetical protein